jgi:1-acyl-sn-glycerol-3-phosphate acyltransferase
MLYRFLKQVVRIALRFFVRKYRYHHKEAFSFKGPLLIACTHPNSFFDALHIDTQFVQPVHSIARGDAFTKPWVRALLEQLKMIPIFRMSEGKENMAQNDETFRKSQELLRNGGILLIFVEGVCVHQKELLLPLKKGAARILQSCWKEGVDVQVLPLWLGYSSFSTYGKTMDMRMGDRFGKEIGGDVDSANCILRVNAEMGRQLLHLQNMGPTNSHAHPEWLRALFFMPAMLGAVLHAPVYLPVRYAVERFTKGTVFFDSVLFGLLLIAYPLFLLMVTLLLWALLGTAFAWLTWVILPALAYSYLHWKK